jgi:hypothetical protein
MLTIVGRDFTLRRNSNESLKDDLPNTILVVARKVAEVTRGRSRIRNQPRPSNGTERTGQAAARVDDPCLGIAVLINDTFSRTTFC